MVGGAGFVRAAGGGSAAPDAADEGGVVPTISSPLATSLGGGSAATARGSFAGGGRAITRLEEELLANHTAPITTIAQGWKRFPAAQEWVDANVAHAANEPAHAEPNISEFQAFLDDQGKSAASGPADTQKLFEQFLAWRKTRATASPAK